MVTEKREGHSGQLGELKEVQGAEGTKAMTGGLQWQGTASPGHAAGWAEAPELCSVGHAEGQEVAGRLLSGGSDVRSRPGVWGVRKDSN